MMILTLYAHSPSNKSSILNANETRTLQKKIFEHSSYKNIHRQEHFPRDLLPTTGRLPAIFIQTLI